MTDSQSLPATYQIGISEQTDLGVVSEAARRLAAVSVPLLCGTTDCEQLLTLLDSLTLLSADLQNHSQVKHYVDRLCFYLDKHPNEALLDKIQQLFPKLISDYRKERWMVGAPQLVTVRQPVPPVEKRSRARHVPGREVFVLQQDDEEEKVALLTLADLRDSLPDVAYELASYEAAWRGASGSTAAALGIKIAEDDDNNTVTTQELEEVSVDFPSEVKSRGFVMPKPKPPKTGREVVDHILSGMLSSQTYIAYLNKPNPTQPYNLVVVPKSKLEREHFIVSSFGVMHVTPNGDNEVCSLSKWLRNAQIYDSIIAIPFFKHFNLLRHFIRWRVNAVLERFKRHRNIIQLELLYVVPTYGKNLLQLHALVYELMTVPVTSLEHIVPGTLKNFSDTAQKQLHFLLKYLTRFLQYTKQLDSTADQHLSSRLEEATVNNRPSPDYLTNPISVQKEKKQKRLQYLHLCRSQHRLLPNYRSAVKFLVQGLVVNFIADATIHLVQRIEKFITDDDGSLVTINLVYSLSPNEEDVIISYPTIDNITSTLNLLLPNINSSVLGCVKEWLPENDLLESERINTILSYNPVYCESMARYNAILTTALREVHQYCQEREWLCEIRSFVRTWESVDTFKGAQASKIQEVLEKLQFWSEHVDGMITESDTSNNLFHVSCSALFSALQPALGEIYETLVKMVQSEFESRGAALIEETQDKHQMLKAQKAEVSSFAEYAKTLGNVKLNTEELLSEKEYIKSLYGILQKIKIDNPLMAEIDKRLELQWELYLMVLQDGETFINKEAPAMLQGLDEQIKTLEIEAELILRKISQADSQYCNPNTDYNKIVPLVEDARKKISDLKDTMTTYSDWKFSITNNYHNLQKMQGLQHKVVARYDVWDTLKTVCDTVQEWKDTKFSEFDTILASEKIQSWAHTADYLRGVLPEKDRILTKLDIRIDNVSKFLPLLVQLSSESVKEHHWQEIQICMSEMYDCKQARLVSNLMTPILLQNKDVISRICGQALTEHTLEQNMLELEQYWESREFTLRKISIPKLIPNQSRKAGSESVFILDCEDNIIGQIDDHQVLLQSILASPYVQELHSRAEMWLVLLQQLHVIMHLWPVCHTNWLFLTNAHVDGKMKVLEEEDTHVFLELDRDFRQLLMVTWEDPLVMSLFGKKSQSNVREMQGDKLIARLETLQRLQEGLMKNLGSIVDNNRDKIPRLHFLSDEDLLSALTNADSVATAKHVTTSCFPNILDITVEPRMDEKDPPKITHIHGTGGEVVPLLQPVVLSAKLLVWLPQLQSMIVETLHNMMHYSLLNVERTALKCGVLETILGDMNLQADPYSESGAHKEYIQNEGSLQTWLSDYPYQCILTTHSIVFTIKLNQWISKKITYAEINGWVVTSYDALVTTLRDLNPRCPLSSRKGVALQSLLLQFLAQRDRLNALRSVEKLSPFSFAVLAVPRFTISPQQGKFDWVNSMLPPISKKSSPKIDISVSQLTATMSYDYEYLGRYNRLVITPITERVQFSLVAAMTLRQTVAITGPANTGKFETVKDYANMLGRYCVEYSDTLKPLLLSHLLAGLIQIGNDTQTLIAARKGRSVASVVVKNNQLCATSETTSSSGGQRCGSRGCLTCPTIVQDNEGLCVNGRILSPGIQLNCCWVVVRMFERSDLLAELGQVLLAVHRGLASLADAKLYNEEKCPTLPTHLRDDRPASHVPGHNNEYVGLSPSPQRPDTVSAEILGMASGEVPPVPNYLGNIMVGSNLVPASGSFQCVLTLPSSQKLPLNLKDCCRAISIVPPELDTIIMAHLISAGYKHYDHLSLKLSCFLTYLDPMIVEFEVYTLPMVKVILKFATSSLMTHESSSGSDEHFSSVSVSSVDETMTQIEEEKVLIDAIVSALTPMLYTKQRGLMKQVLQEVFPLSVSHVYNMSVPGRVKAMVLEQFESNKYEVVSALLEKTLELYHVLQHKKCVIVAGPTGCGKTTMFRVLSNAINFMQATEARVTKDRSSTQKGSSFPPTPTLSKIGTPQTTDQGSRRDLGSRDYGSRDHSILGTGPPSRQRSVRKGLINKSLIMPQKTLNILEKPDTRCDSDMSGTATLDTQHEQQKIRTFRLFVNTLTFDEFVGSGTAGSEEGIFVNLCKKFSSPPSLEDPILNWILLDGNLKTYMESLLSTAISNRAISSLDTSQIRIKDNIQFLVETTSLGDITPSFITKCGVVVMNNSIVGWRQRFRSWLKKAEKEFYLTKSRVFTLTVLMETFIGQMIQFLDMHMQFIIRIDKNHTQEVSALLRWLNVLFSRYMVPQQSDSTEEHLNSITVLIFIMAYVWSFGANIADCSLAAFSDFVKNQIKESNHKVECPESGTVFDWCINSGKLRFDLWSVFFHDLKAASSVTFTSTILHESTLYLTEMLQSSGVPVLIAGHSSSGKSAFVQNCILPKLHPTKIKVSHLTTRRQLEDNIENRLIQFTRRQQAMATHSLPSLLIENFNVIPNRGSKMGLHEVLRKVLAQGETYSFKRKVFRKLGSSHLILTCNSVDSVGAGGHVAVGDINERLSKNFNILPLREPNEFEWRGIFYPIVLSWLDDFPAYKLGMKAVLSTAIVGATCKVYSLLREKIKPVPGQTHCIFDAHALSQVFQGIFLLSPTSKFRQMRQNMKGGGQNERRRGQSIAKQKSISNDREVFKNIAHLWNHEVQRVFTDRVIDTDARSEIYRDITDVMQEFFCTPILEKGEDARSVARKMEEKYSANVCVNMKKTIRTLLLEDLGEVEIGLPLLDCADLMSDLPFSSSDLIFTKHLAENTEVYCEETVPAILSKLDQYMSSTPGVDMVCYSGAAKHCARLSRSIMLGTLSIMLGPKGSGRKVLALATAKAHGYSVRYIPSPSSGVNFNDELRDALVEAGSASTPVLLFIEHGWDLSELPDIMYFISEGSHPSLIDPSHVNSTSYGNVNMEVFYKRAHSQIHIVFSLNTENKKLPDRLAEMFTTYPCALKECTSLDYYSLWPSGTLSEIAFTFLERFEQQKKPDLKASPENEELTKMLSDFAAGVHLVALREGEAELADISSFVNPCSFLDLLHIYTIMEDRFKTDITARLDVFNSVNLKVAQVENILDSKKSRLTSLRPVLKTAQLVYQGWTEELKVDRIQLQKSQEACRVEDENISKRQQELSDLESLNNLDLNEVSPALELAVEALSSVNKADIVELKSFKNPPELVKFSLEALCILFGKEPTWECSLLLLQDAALMKDMVNLKKEKIKASTLQKLKREYLDDPRFTQEVIGAVSKATNCIQAYIAGVYKYSTTIKKLKPKQKRYSKLTADLEQSQKSLGKKRLHQEELQKHLDAKAVKMDESFSQIKTVQFTMKVLSKEVKSAQDLLESIKPKTSQWQNEKDDLEQLLLKADGDAILCAGAVTYFGPFSAETRTKMLNMWTKGFSEEQSFITEGVVTRSAKFDLVEVLSSPTERLNLEKMGLPKDRQSFENLLMIRELLKVSRRKILVSDPDDQLKQWAPFLINPAVLGESSSSRFHDSLSDLGRNIPTVSSMSSELVRGSEMDVFNTTDLAEYVLYYTVEELGGDGTVSTKSSSNKNNISIITGVCEGNSSLATLPVITDTYILASTLTTTQLSSKSLDHTSVINFKLSREGMTNALLRQIVYEQAKNLQSKEAGYARSKLNRLAAIENSEKSLLEYITAFKGSLLDSQDLRPMIEGTQELISSEEHGISDANHRIAALQKKIQEYLPLADHCALIVEVFDELNKLSPHYKFKLIDLVDLLGDVLGRKVHVSLSTSAKVADYKKEIHMEVFQKLQLVMSVNEVGFFPLLLVMKNLLRTGKMSKEEFRLFLNHSIYQFPYYPDEIPTWITKSCWASLDLLEELKVFKGLKDNMQQNQALYQEYFTLSPVLLEPSPWDDITPLTLTQRALLWLFTRPAETSKVFSDLIMYELGSEMIRTSSMHLPLSLSDRAPSLIIADSDDSRDAVHDVHRLASCQGREVKVMCMLRESMLSEAEQIIKQGVKYGYWVLLTQCHCIKNWSESILELMVEISEIMANRQESLPRKVHHNFKLILVSSMSSDIYLPEDLMSRFSVRTHHCNSSSISRIEQRAKRCLEVEIPMGKESVPEQVVNVLSQMHSHLLANSPDSDQLLAWSDNDLNTTLRLLYHLTQDNCKELDLREAVKSLVGLVTYGSKTTTDSHENILFAAIEKFLSFEVDKIPSHPSLLKMQLQTSSLTLKSLPSITLDNDCPILSLERFPSTDKKLDVNFVTNFILSSLPSPPRIVQSRGLTALSLFFGQQAEHYTELLATVTDHLVTIQEVMSGHITLAENTAQLMRDLSSNSVPDSWETGFTRGLGRWVSELSDKVWRLSRMIGADTVSEMSGRQSSTTEYIDTSIIYCINSFTKPRHFILSYLYDWAANNDVPLSDVSFRVKVVSLVSPGPGPDNGVFVEGLELVRAGWDAVKSLMYPTPPSSPPFPLPPVLLLPFNKQEEDISTDSLPQLTVTRIECPVFTRKGEFVAAFVLPSSHAVNQWRHLKPAIRIN